jgi:ABC-type Fe3+-hydroxamate transport system substrate-binding protein
VRRGRFAVIQSELANRPGPRVGRALEQIAAALYPDAFAEDR